MALIVYSKSPSFEGHLNQVIDGEISYRTSLTTPLTGPANICLVHASSFDNDLSTWLEVASQKGMI